MRNIHNFPLLVMLVTIGCGTPIAASSGDITTTSRIDAVTVYADRAQVTRAIQASVPEGAHRLIVADLPLAMLRESLRSRAGGSGMDTGIELGRVALVERPMAHLVGERERELTREIEALETQQRIRADRIEAQRIKLEFIERISSTATSQINEQIERGMGDPERWTESWETLVGGATEALQQIRLAEEDQLQLQGRIDKARQELQQLATGARSTLEAAIDIRAEAAADITIELTYQVANARWQPQYDARLDSEAGTLVLQQYGSVFQGTGEDWQDVTLSLSTTRPARGTLPELQPWRIDVFEPVMPMASGELRSFAKSREAQVPAAALAEADQAGGAMEEAEAVLAAAVTSEFAAEYRIDRPVTIPADRSSHQVLIDRITHPVTLRAEAVPKLRKAAFLVAGIEHDGAAPFPGGQVTLFRDGAMVGTSHLALLRPGEKRDLSFGIDDRIEIDYRLDTGQRSSEGIINSYRRIERRFHMSAVNHHETPMELTILDQIPVAQDERIEVELLNDGTAPTETDHEEMRGVLAWKRTLDPGAELKIRLGFAVTYPDDLEVGGF